MIENKSIFFQFLSSYFISGNNIIGTGTYGLIYEFKNQDYIIKTIKKYSDNNDTFKKELLAL